MIRLYYIKKGTGLTWEKNPATLSPPGLQKIVWVDMQSSGEGDKRMVEDHFGIELFTPQEAAEIESSSRYYEEGDNIEANNAFIVFQEKAYTTDAVSFILKRGVLFTLRNADLRSFAWTVKKLKTIKDGQDVSGMQIMLTLLESQIDLDADFIENISRQTTDISRQLLKGRSFQQEVLIRITELQENTIIARESLVDKQRLVSSLTKSNSLTNGERERLRIITKDVGSILQHTEFGFERLEYLQNTFLGLVNIEQNKVIKIFTVVTVVFMPPTLIASIYGMNFNHMPELKWPFGYPLAVGLMILSSLAFLLYFKRKKWL